MALVTDPFTFTNGTVADATEVNSRFDTLYTLVNGNINAANMGLTAAFDWSTDVTTTDGLTITADSLTTGSAFKVYSNSADTGTRNVAEVINDNALSSSATALYIRQDADQVAFKIDQNGQSTAFLIDSQSTTENTVLINADTLTTGTVFEVGDADSLTTGDFFNFVSNSADASSRFLGTIINDNALATGAACLRLKQDASATGLFIDSGANGKGIDIAATLLTTSAALNIQDLDALTTGFGIYITSDSADTGTRNLQLIHNNNAAAVNATCLTLKQDAVGTAFSVKNPAGTTAFEVKEDGGLLLPDIDAPGSNELVRMSGAKIWGAYSITGATTIAATDSFNTVSVVVASWGAVTVSWGVNKMATTSYLVTTCAGGTGAASDKFASYNSAGSSRSQVGLNVYDLSVGGYTVTASNLFFAVHGDAA